MSRPLTAGAIPKNRELSPKEAANFKQLLRFYEYKQYKKGLKVADQIIKKFPNHGETLAMKGLFLSHMDAPGSGRKRKDEGYELVKLGLRNDLTSHICWHVYGLMYRADKNYEEAAKCYSHALKYDQDNGQILRDFSLLQIQMRNYEAYNQIRHHLLRLRNNNRSHWIALAISYHLLNRYDVALQVLDSYESTFPIPEAVGRRPDFEHSETLLYRCMVLEEMGEFTRGLKFLSDIEKRGVVCDIRYVKEKRALFYLKAGHTNTAEKAYGLLLEENPDCLEYVEGILQCRNLQIAKFRAGTNNRTKRIELHDIAVEMRSSIVTVLESLAKRFPTSNLLKRLPLTYATASSSAFSTHADVYLRRHLRKGVPSLFSDLKALYDEYIPVGESKDEQKGAKLGKLVTDFIINLEKDGVLSNDIEDEKVDPVIVQIWARFFLAQHYDKLHDIPNALQHIDQAIILQQQSSSVISTDSHTENGTTAQTEKQLSASKSILLELYMTKARILKHAGDLAAAEKLMVQARELDLQDRFINTKCTKYLLRNDNSEEAKRTIKMFVRPDIADPMQDLIDMQCMWFAYEHGCCYLRQNQLGRALKTFHQLSKHFDDIMDDQFDFHTYCFRKMTIRPYVDMLRFEDNLRAHPYYLKTAKSAIECYLRLHDNPMDVNNQENDSSLANLSPEEVKKQKSKQRKAELRGQQNGSTDRELNENKEFTARTGQGKSSIVTAPKDEDPFGDKYLQTKTPLEEAVKFLRPLLDLASGRTETYTLAFEIYIRQGKILLALRSLKKALDIDCKHSLVHQQCVRFWMTVKQQSSLHPLVQKVLDLEMPEIYGSSDIESYIHVFSDANKREFACALASGIALLLVDPKNTKKASAVICNAVADKSNTRGLTLEKLIEAHQFLKTSCHDTDGANTLAKQAVVYFPHSTYFKPMFQPPSYSPRKQKPM